MANMLEPIQKYSKCKKSAYELITSWATWNNLEGSGLGSLGIQTAFARRTKTVRGPHAARLAVFGPRWSKPVIAKYIVGSLQ